MGPYAFELHASQIEATNIPYKMKDQARAL